MIRTPRLNPRAQALHQNPSGFAVAAVVVVLGVAGAGGYLLYKTKEAAGTYKKDFQDALGVVYVTEGGWLRFLPGGAIQLLFGAPGEQTGTFTVTKAPNVPVDAAVGRVVAETLKGLSTDRADGWTPQDITDSNTYASYSAPGKLKVRLVPRERFMAALKGEMQNGDDWAKFREALSPLVKQAMEEFKAAQGSSTTVVAPPSPDEIKQAAADANKGKGKAKAKAKGKKK